MSKIILKADRFNGYLHQVQSDGGNYYWVSTTNVPRPLGRGDETMIVRCRKSGSSSKRDFETAKIISHGEFSGDLQAKHLWYCRNVERCL